jgi:molybdopterin molybdotransferase
MLTVAEALQRTVSGVTLLDAEWVSLDYARGRVLAEPATARITQPPFDASAMDGYALTAHDIAAQTPSVTVVGVSAAGHPFAGAIKPGEAVRIFTGAPVPDGGAAILIQENATRLSETEIAVGKTPRLGESIRKRGIDFAEGGILIEVGETLTASHILLAAAANAPKVAVRKRPRVAILATGDELVQPGETPADGQIVSSIPPALAAAVAHWGAEPVLLGIARDTLDSLAGKIEAGRNADVIVTIGGASVGEHDLVKQAFEAKGAAFDVVKVAMRPGKPLMLGRLDHQRIVGLPGNPASAMLTALLFLKPLIFAMTGRAPDHVFEERSLGAPIPANGDRMHFMRARATATEVAAMTDQDSSLVSILAKSNCVIVREPHATGANLGERVRILPLDF